MAKINPISNISLSKPLKTTNLRAKIFNTTKDSFTKTSSISFGSNTEKATPHDKINMYKRATIGLDEDLVEDIIKLPSAKIYPFCKIKGNNEYLLSNDFLNGLKKRGMAIEQANSSDVNFRIDEKNRGSFTFPHTDDLYEPYTVVCSIKNANVLWLNLNKRAYI